MSPALLVGDQFFVDHLPHELAVGDLVMLPSPTQPEKKYIRRVSALPGQTVDSASVPEGSVFVRAEAPSRGNDSRQWGPIPIASIEGHVLSIMWSYSGDDGVRWSRIGTTVH